MSKTNCCNCGAALDIFAPKCEFCGTKNINMTEIDLASGEAANFIFKLPNNITINGNIYMSMLAVPELKTLEMGLNLRAVPHADSSLCYLTKQENSVIIKEKGE